MNKAEFAVCRIKEKLPGNQGFATKGSGCVVHCESLTSSWGWKCQYSIVTPSVVLCQEDLASEKVFVAEFLSKDNRGLETFELKQMAEVCKDVVGRRLDNLDLDLYLTFLSVEPLDKRGFLKKMVKKGSLQTFRPLESFEFENKSSQELAEGLFCQVIVDLFSDQRSTNSPFTTQTYKLVYDSQTREFSLQDFGGMVKNFNKEIPPIGAVIFTKKGEFAGLLRNFSNNLVTAIFLPEPSKTGNNKKAVTSFNTANETSVKNNRDVTTPEISSGQEIQCETNSTKLMHDNTQVEGDSEDVTLQKNNNIAPPAGNAVDVENNDLDVCDVVKDGGYNRNEMKNSSDVIKHFQECPENLFPCDKTENIETETLLMSTDNTTRESNSIKQCEEEGGPELFYETVKPSNAVGDFLEKAGGSDEVAESFDELGKSSDERTAEEVEVVPCKAGEVGDTVQSPGEVQEELSDTEVDPCVVESSSGQPEEQETGASQQGRLCNAEGGTGATVDEPPGDVQEQPNWTKKATESEATLSDAVKDGEVQKELSDTEVDPCAVEGSSGQPAEEQETGASQQGCLCNAEGGTGAAVDEPPGDVQEQPCWTKKATESEATLSDAVKDGEVQEELSDTEVNPCVVEGSSGQLAEEQETGASQQGLYAEGGTGAAVDETPGDVQEQPHWMKKATESEATMSETVKAGTDAADHSRFRQSITRHDSSLITVVQVDETLLQMEINNGKEEGEHDDSEVYVSENCEGVTATKQSEMTVEQSSACLSEKDEGQLTELNKDKHFPAVNQSVILQNTDVSAKTQGNQELTSISEKTVNTLHDSWDISVCNTPKVEDITDIGFVDDGLLKEEHHSSEELSENKNEKDLLIGISQSMDKNHSGELEDVNGEPFIKNDFEDITVSGVKDEHTLKPGDIEGHDDVTTNLHEKDNSIKQTVETNGDGESHGGDPCVADDEVRTHKDCIDIVHKNNVEEVSDKTKNLHEQCSQKLDSIQAGEEDENALIQKDLNKEVTENGSDITGVSEIYADKEKRMSFGEKSVESHDSLASKELPIEELSHDDFFAVHRVDADALLTETITNNPCILSELGSCLDTEYQYGRVPCWRDLAELLAISPEDYEHCGTFSVTSPTEDLFVFLSATKPHLTIQDIKEALKVVDRLDVAYLLDRKIAAGLLSEESVVGSLVERDDTNILGRMALKLDRTKTNDWKRLALQLNVPHRVLRNFGCHQRHNSALMLLKYIPIFDPELTLDNLKSCLTSIGRIDAAAVLDKARIPGDEPVKDILDDSELLDQITDMLDDDSTHHWRHLAKELKIPQEKCKIFEPTEDDNSPTKLLFRSIEKCEPDLTFEELVLALVAMKRQDVLDVLQKYFSSDDIDQILEENNLLTPTEDPSLDQKEI